MPFVTITMPTSKKTVDSKSKSIIKTVIERCNKEKINNMLLVPLDDCEERVSYYTGFPKTYIYKLINKHENKQYEPWPFDIADRILILKCLKEFYLKRESPKYKDVYELIKNQINVTDLTQFQQEMASMGFGYRKTSTGYILMEDPKITFERFHYLNKIRKLRENKRNIYYIDERLVDPNLSFAKPWVDNVDIFSKSYQGLVLFHVISKDGYDNGLFCYQATTEDFKRWVMQILLPVLKPSSVIVMDSNPLHGMPGDMTLSRYHSKEDMFKWLKDNNIPCNTKMRKAELYELIDKCAIRVEHANIDRVLKAHGHDVLRLPFKYHDLSATELLWRDLKNDIGKGIAQSVDMLQLKNRINQEISSMSPTKWLTYDRIVANNENHLFEIDTIIEIALEEYELDTTAISSYEESLSYSSYNSCDFEDGDSE